MITRRGLGKSLGILTAVTLLSAARHACAMTNSRAVWFMPDEGGPHARTWMAFGASAQI